MTVRFRLAPHAVEPNQQVVECWYDGQFVACIYPHHQGLRIISKHTKDVTIDTLPREATIITFHHPPTASPEPAPATEHQP